MFYPSAKVAKILRERERQEKTTNGSTFVNCHGENIVNFVQQKLGCFANLFIKVLCQVHFFYFILNG